MLKQVVKRASIKIKFSSKILGSTKVSLKIEYRRKKSLVVSFRDFDKLHVFGFRLKLISVGTELLSKLLFTLKVVKKDPFGIFTNVQLRFRIIQV